MTRRCIGLDVHRDLMQVAIWEAGRVRQAGRVPTTPEALRVFADSLAPSDEVALEATGNTHAIVRLLESRVARVVVSNPQETRAIAEAKVKTDKVDAEILAQLLAADYLPGVWVADEDAQARRRQVARRAHLVRQRTRLKNQVPSAGTSSAPHEAPRNRRKPSLRGCAHRHQFEPRKGSGGRMHRQTTPLARNADCLPPVALPVLLRCFLWLSTFAPGEDRLQLRTADDKSGA